jgi:alkylhydroperoxidase/carboxymuconolactone decarboxylase family protein YurZ
MGSRAEAAVLHPDDTQEERAMRKGDDDKADLPAAAGQVATTYPDLYRAYAALGAACAASGPIEAQAQRLVKLAFALGAGSEGGVHSHARRGIEEGIAPAALKQVALLAIPTLGFPRAVAALTWIEDVTDPGKGTPARG